MGEKDKNRIALSTSVGHDELSPAKKLAELNTAAKDFWVVQLCRCLQCGQSFVLLLSTV